MAFDEEGWTARVRKAKMDADISALIMELPERPLPEPKKETEEDEKELYLLEGRTPVRCFDEREVDFFVPIYKKIGNDCINGIQITTMFVFRDRRCFGGMTNWFGKDSPLLFETSVYAKIPGVEVKYVPMLCSTYDEAEQMHQIAVERVRTTPLEELAHVYSHIIRFQNNQAHLAPIIHSRASNTPDEPSLI